MLSLLGFTFHAYPSTRSHSAGVPNYTYNNDNNSFPTEVALCVSLETFPDISP